jgi:menaquinone-dependent protoporphyrinogen oxidase
MLVLVAYATRHGATQGIAERIAETLRADGLEAELLPVTAAGDLARYDACVIGSAVYLFHWLKDAAKFLQRNQSTLAAKPVWLFSSGPLGDETVDAEGRDPRAVSAPKEIGELQAAVNARDHHIFFGAFQRGKPVGFGERVVSMMPAARAALPEGDFRDWQDIEHWAEGIARALS